MAPDVSVVAPGGGEVIDLGRARIRILEDGTITAHRLGIAEITIPPRTDGPPQHRHARHDEGFYVVAGTAQFTVGSDVHEAPAGTLVMVPPGAPHTFANPGNAGHGSPGCPAHLRQPGRAAAGHAQHLHPGPVRPVLPRPERHDRRRPADDPAEHRRNDGPLRHKHR